MLPKKLRHHGIGKYCVDWLKFFSCKYGFTYTILGAFDSASGFWFKMDFKDITHSSIKKHSRKCNYCEIEQYFRNNKINVSNKIKTHK